MGSREILNVTPNIETGLANKSLLKVKVDLLNDPTNPVSLVNMHTTAGVNPESQETSDDRRNELMQTMEIASAT